MGIISDVPNTPARGLSNAIAPPSAVLAIFLVHLCEQVRTVHKKNCLSNFVGKAIVPGMGIEPTLALLRTGF